MRLVYQSLQFCGSVDGKLADVVLTEISAGIGTVRPEDADMVWKEVSIQDLHILFNRWAFENHLTRGGKRGANHLRHRHGLLRQFGGKGSECSLGAFGEAIILGDGGPRYVEVVRLLVAGGANVNLADGSGVTPLAHARQRGFTEIIDILEGAGAQ